MDNAPRQKCPLWVVITAIIIALPCTMTPWVLSALPPGSPLVTLAYIYPIAAAAYSILACLTWPQRPTLGAILLAMSVLTTLAIFSPLYL